MNVKELIELLATLPQEATVVVAKDSEGNGWSPLIEITEGKYAPESTWSGYYIDKEYIGNDEYAQPEDQLGKGFTVTDAICLWPVN